MIVGRYRCGDGKSYFDLNDDGRIQLKIFPENRSIFMGYWKPNLGLLLLTKGKDNRRKRSYTYAIPKEIWNGLDDPIKVVGLCIRDTNKFYAITTQGIALYGYDDFFKNSDPHGQEYLFIDPEHWTEVLGEEGVVDFTDDYMERCNNSRIGDRYAEIG